MAKVLSRIIGTMALLSILGIQRTWVGVLCIVLKGDGRVGMVVLGRVEG